MFKRKSKAVRISCNFWTHLWWEWKNENVGKKYIKYIAISRGFEGGW